MLIENFGKDKFDIIVLAGQSNAEGWGYGNATEEYLPDDRIMWMNDSANARFEKNEQGIDEFRLSFPTEKTITVADEPVLENGKVGKMALFFAKQYINEGRLADDRKILILCCAVGGTGFHDNQWGLPSERTLYQRLKDFTQTALSLNKENRLVAFLWHQGENDSLSGKPSDEKYSSHKKNLGEMLADYKTKFNCQDIPFIAGGFVYDWYLKNVEICDPILKAIREICQENGAFVESEGLKSNNEQIGNGDDLHFCRESAHILGGRYFEAYKGLVK